MSLLPLAQLQAMFQMPQKCVRAGQIVEFFASDVEFIV